ncbi:MAG: AMP-binding protein [Hyphomicrobium sp.]|nr:AMP-binding protein [Hyphomicrobium sp.]
MRDLLRLVIMLYRLRPQWRGDLASVRAQQTRRLRQLLLHAKQHSPFYRRRFAGIDVTQCRLSDLPTLSKSDMMASFDDVMTDRRIQRCDVEHLIAEPGNLGRLYLGRYGICHTSGSQGQPALIVQDKKALMLTFAVQFARGTAVQSRWLPHVDRLWNPARMAVITQQPGFYPSGAAFGYLPAAAKPFFKVLHLSVFDPMEENVVRLNAFQPEFITGYTSSLEALAREESAGRLRLRQTGCLKQITNISEPLPASSAAWLETVFGVHVTDEYAMGECLALSSGCPHYSGSHLNADLAILEVVDEKMRPVPDGVAGSKVLLTNLYNRVQPFIRYEVDDIVTMSPTPCACGSCLPHIKSVEGRSKDKLWIEVGGRYRELPSYVFLVAMHHYLEVAEHQVLQTGFNTFVLRAAPQPSKVLSADRMRELVFRSLKSEGLADVVRVDIEIVPQIAKGPSGKVARVRNLFGAPPVALDTQPM